MSRPNWFVAFAVSAPEVRAALGEPPPHVRAFHPDDLHATLAFLGPVSEHSARAGWDALAIDLPPRLITLGAVVPLGPSALCAIVDDPALRDAIGRARDPVFAASGARRDARPPLPHVTVARTGRAAERDTAIAWARGLSLDHLAARIDRVALYTWSLDRRTQLFRVVESRALRRVLG